MFSIITIVVCVLFNFLVSFLCNYCYDTVILWPKENEDFKLSYPSILDVEGSNIYVMDQYVQREVRTACRYFILRNDLKAASEENNDTESIGVLLFLSLPALCLFAKTLCDLTPISKILCYVIASAVCILGFVLVSFIYKRTNLKLISFNKTKSEFEKWFSGTKEFEYNVSYETAFNSFVISVHLQYLLSVEKTIRTRRVLRSFLSKAAIVFFVLAAVIINY